MCGTEAFRLRNLSRSNILTCVTRLTQACETCYQGTAGDYPIASRDERLTTSSLMSPGMLILPAQLLKLCLLIRSFISPCQVPASIATISAVFSSTVFRPSTVASMPKHCFKHFIVTQFCSMVNSSPTMPADHITNVF